MSEPTAPLDIDGLFARDSAMTADPDGTASLDALNGKAVAVLQEVLCASSEDVRRKAAVDILNFNQKSRAAVKPLVTEEQLEYLGKIVVETAEIRERQLRGEGSARVSEVPS